MALARPSLSRQIRSLVALAVVLVVAFAITTQFANPVLSADSAIGTSVFVKESSADNGKPLDNAAPFDALLVIAVLFCAVSCLLLCQSRQLIPSSLISFVNAPTRAPPFFPHA